MRKTKLQDDKSGRNGNPFIYYEEHEANEKNKNGHRFKNLLFTLDPKIYFSE